MHVPLGCPRRVLVTCNSYKMGQPICCNPQHYCYVAIVWALQWLPVDFRKMLVLSYKVFITSFMVFRFFAGLWSSNKSPLFWRLIRSGQFLSIQNIGGESGGTVPNLKPFLFGTDFPQTLVRPPAWHCLRSFRIGRVPGNI